MDPLNTPQTNEFAIIGAKPAGRARALRSSIDSCTRDGTEGQAASKSAPAAMAYDPLHSAFDFDVRFMSLSHNELNAALSLAELMTAAAPLPSGMAPSAASFPTSPSEYRHFAAVFLNKVKSEMKPERYSVFIDFLEEEKDKVLLANELRVLLWDHEDFIPTIEKMLRVKVSPGPYEMFLSGVLTSLAPIGESCGSHTIRGHWGGKVNGEFVPNDSFEWKHQIAPGEDAERFPQDGEFNGCSYSAGEPVYQDEVKLAFEPVSIQPQQFFTLQAQGNATVTCTLKSPVLCQRILDRDSLFSSKGVTQK